MQFSSVSGIPNEIDFGKSKLVLLVAYPCSEYIEFVLGPSTAHQLKALQAFVSSGEKEKTITVPHPMGGLFVAKFTMVEKVGTINKTYSYLREDGNTVRFLVSCLAQVGFWQRMNESY